LARKGQFIDEFRRLVAADKRKGSRRLGRRLFTVPTPFKAVAGDDRAVVALYPL